MCFYLFAFLSDNTIARSTAQIVKSVPKNWVWIKIKITHPIYIIYVMILLTSAWTIKRKKNWNICQQENIITWLTWRQQCSVANKIQNRIKINFLFVLFRCFIIDQLKMLSYYTIDIKIYFGGLSIGQFWPSR